MHVCGRVGTSLLASFRLFKGSTGEAAAQYRLSSGGVATITSLLPKSQKAVMWKAMLEKTTRYSKKANKV